jgi:hypothetical protein
MDITNGLEGPAGLSDLLPSAASRFPLGTSSGGTAASSLFSSTPATASSNGVPAPNPGSASFGSGASGLLSSILPALPSAPTLPTPASLLFSVTGSGTHAAATAPQSYAAEQAAAAAAAARELATKVEREREQERLRQEREKPDALTRAAYEAATAHV